jgi:hypothetical protein
MLWIAGYRSLVAPLYLLTSMPNATNQSRESADSEDHGYLTAQHLDQRLAKPGRQDETLMPAPSIAASSIRHRHNDGTDH